jgi:hypothetical protein
VGFVWRTLRRHGVPERELEDACQEVFLCAHQTWGGSEARASVYKWLSAISVQVARATPQNTNLRRGLLGPGMHDSFTELVVDGLSSAPSGATWVESVTTGKQTPPPLEDGVLEPSMLEPGIDARVRMLAQLEGALGTASMAPPAATAKLFWLSLALGASVVLGGAALLLQPRDGAVTGALPAGASTPRVSGPIALPPATAPNAQGPSHAASHEPLRLDRAALHGSMRLGVLAEGRGERALLEAAQRALPTRAAHALELTADHARMYPRGRLGEQRELIAIEALRVLGRTNAARERARSFEQSFPHPDARARLMRALGPE